MTETQKRRGYDLEERTYAFARRCRDFAKKIPQTIANKEYTKQFIRSSGSIAANYIEANESLSRRDFFHRVRISRKETKETRLWLQLIEIPKEEDVEEQKALEQEATELMRIFGAIIEKEKT